MTIDAARIERVIAGARARIDRRDVSAAEEARASPSVAPAHGPAVLLETEGLELLQALGIQAPPHVFVRDSAEAAAADTTALGGDRVVVKVISPIILHKSDVGGVKIVRAPTATRSCRPSATWRRGWAGRRSSASRSTSSSATTPRLATS